MVTPHAQFASAFLTLRFIVFYNVTVRRGIPIMGNKNMAVLRTSPARASSIMYLEALLVWRRAAIAVKVMKT